MTASRPLALVLCILPAATLSAQRGGMAEWRVPDHAFVELQRTRTVKGKLGGANAPASRSGFYAHDILPGTSKIEPRPMDYRDLGSVIALSLPGRLLRENNKHGVNRTIWNVPPFVGLRVRGTFAVEEIGERVIVERGEFKVTAIVPPEERAANPQAARRRALRVNLTDGLLTVTREIDLIAGGIKSAKSRFTGTQNPVPEKRPARNRHGKIIPKKAAPVMAFVVDESLVRGQTLAPDQREFQAQVDKAIRTGCEFLMKKLQGPRRQKLDAGKRGGQTQNSGRLALLILTLIKGEVDRRDPVLVAALDDLRRRVITDTYSLASALLALEAYHAPMNERQQIIDGYLNGPVKRVVPESDLVVMRRWVKSLLQNVDTRVDRGYTLRFNYLAAKRFDNSNCQYAALGLYSAHLCGIDINKGVWMRLCEHWLKEQGEPEGRPTRLGVTTYSELREQKRRRAAGNGPTVASMRSMRARGWGYVNRAQPKGSMTCAGITALTVAESALMQSKHKSHGLLSKVDQAIRGGYAWLHENYSVRHNPRAGKSWYYYYLYSLERACELGGVARIGARDWYWDGAVQLLSLQRGDGSWGNIVDTSFAVLFLKKAALPVRTGARR